MLTFVKSSHSQLKQLLNSVSSIIFLVFHMAFLQAFSAFALSLSFLQFLVVIHLSWLRSEWIWLAWTSICLSKFSFFISLHITYLSPAYLDSLPNKKARNAIYITMPCNVKVLKNVHLQLFLFSQIKKRTFIKKFKFHKPNSKLGF